MLVILYHNETLLSAGFIVIRWAAVVCATDAAFEPATGDCTGDFPARVGVGATGRGCCSRREGTGSAGAFVTLSAVDWERLRVEPDAQPRSGGVQLPYRRAAV